MIGMFSSFVDLFMSAGLIVFSLSTGFLLPVIPNITKCFYIGKQVINADNITGTKTLKINI